MELVKGVRREMYMKGVNLGNWLVLEKWMSPALFAGTDATGKSILLINFEKQLN